MATKKTNRQAEATRQKEEKFDCQIEEHRKAKMLLSDEIKEHLKAVKKLRDEIKEHEKAEKQLREQKRELKKTNRKPSESSLDENDPIIKIVNLDQLPQFMELIEVMQKYTTQEIVPKKTTFIEFDLKGKPLIQRTLVKTLNKEIKVFSVTERQVLLYLSCHTNLGNYECLKMAVYRERKRLEKYYHTKVK